MIKLNNIPIDISAFYASPHHNIANTIFTISIKLKKNLSLMVTLMLNIITGVRYYSNKKYDI